MREGFKPLGAEPHPPTAPKFSGTGAEFFAIIAPFKITSSSAVAILSHLPSLTFHQPVPDGQQQSYFFSS